MHLSILLPSPPLCTQAEAALREQAGAKAAALAEAEKRFRQLETVMRRVAAKKGRALGAVHAGSGGPLDGIH